MKPLHLIWALCTAYVLTVLLLTEPLHGWWLPTIAVLGVAGGYLLLLALIALTWSFALPLWEQLFGPDV